MRSNKRITLNCTSYTGDILEFAAPVGGQVAVYVSTVRDPDKVPRLIETIYLSPEDTRKLFGWFGVQLHKFGPGRSDDNQGP